MKVNIPIKRTGDLLTANEFNQVVEAINTNVDEMTAAIAQMQSVKQVFLTQQAYDLLVSRGLVEQDTLYNIYE